MSESQDASASMKMRLPANYQRTVPLIDLGGFKTENAHSL